jgi:uncharacterized protein
MKTLLILAAVTLSVVLPVFAQEVDKMPMITVTGKAEIQVTPDQVDVSLDITRLNMDMQVAKNEVETAIKNVRDLAKRFAVETRNIKIGGISVEKKFISIRDPKNRIYDEDGDEIGKKVFKGYEVSASVSILLTDLSKFEGFFAEALKTGISEVDSVSFETSKLREHRDKARDMAMKAAKEKASAMAGSVGQTIGKAVKITEGTISNRFLSNLTANATSNSVGFARSVSEPMGAFTPGSINVEAEATVSFLLN